ncbi:hypothetical protein PT974_09575 [Cladobotryum mycophilum]|uniref:F-type H+-transporting ATPase subunit J n=1 Tax=Cladobotryum mycophilum TaxID=491253 RepID=A0ABR0SHR9_9HYPO
MSWLGVIPFKKFPAPFLKPHLPFFVAGLVIAYGANSAQNAMSAADEWKHDPRNPLVKAGAKGH